MSSKKTKTAPKKPKIEYKNVYVEFSAKVPVGLATVTNLFDFVMSSDTDDMLVSNVSIDIRD